MHGVTGLHPAGIRSPLTPTRPPRSAAPALTRTPLPREGPGAPRCPPGHGPAAASRPRRARGAGAEGPRPQPRLPPLSARSPLPRAALPALPPARPSDAVLPRPRDRGGLPVSQAGLAQGRAGGAEGRGGCVAALWGTRDPRGGGGGRGEAFGGLRVLQSQLMFWKRSVKRVVLEHRGMAKVCVSKRPQPGCVRSPCHGAPASSTVLGKRPEGRRGTATWVKSPQRGTENAQRDVKQPTAALGGSPLRLVPGQVMLINN